MVGWLTERVVPDGPTLEKRVEEITFSYGYVMHILSPWNDSFKKMAPFNLKNGYCFTAFFQIDVRLKGRVAFQEVCDNLRIGSKY